ncbi:MAG TPA: hypothetical protein VEY31_14885, partial [Roseococcus sp.]|nr:hypothetical protein [Roseococcus sp.]
GAFVAGLLGGAYPVAAMATDPPRPQREARSHVRPPPPAAARPQAPHRAARTYSDGPRLRDAPQELIPVLGPEMRGALAHSSPRAACLQATRRAEHIHGVPAGLLTAVALAESGLHAHALSIGGRAHYPETRDEARALLASAGGRSVMAGCVQVNARVHARGSDWPLDPMTSADWAGGMMARWARETGSWPEALRRWHGGSVASTQRLVCRVRAKLEVTNPQSDLFDSYACEGSASVRRNGAIHLATAESQAGF